MNIKTMFLIMLLALIIQYEVAAQWFTFTSSNLPILIINSDTQSPQEKNSFTAILKIIDNGKNQRNNLTDNPVFQTSIRVLNLDSITLVSSKKSFEFITTNEKGLPLSVGLLGMPAATNWVLDALDGDNSFMRTFLGFKFYRMLGNYAPNIQYCELILNNEYWGLYLLKEVITRGTGQLNISELDSNDITGDSLTGGYIIKVTAYDNNSTGGWLSNHESEPRIYFQYCYPAVDKIMPEQASFIQTTIENFESMMEGPNFEDPSIGYQKFINVDNFADFALINEITHLLHAFGVDAYMYYDGQSIMPFLHMGPVWDFNRVFNGAWNRWEIEDDPQPFWWQRLWKSQYFRQRESNNWYHFRRNRLTNVVLSELIDTQKNYLAEAYEHNYYRWENFWSNPPNYDRNVRSLKDYLTSRFDWLDHLLLKIEPEPQNIHPKKHFLAPVFPNPFNSSTQIEYFLAQPTKLRLEIYDVIGRLVFVVAEGDESAGFHSKSWYGKDSFGFPVSSGVYYCRLMTASQCLYRKIILLR